MAAPIYRRLQDLRDVTHGSPSARHVLRWNASTSKYANDGALVGSTRAFDPRDFGAVAGNFDTVSEQSTRDANTVAVQAAIDAAQSEGGHVIFTQFYWCSVGLTNNGLDVDMRGLSAGWATGIGTPDTSGTLLSLTNARFDLERLRFFGPCEYLPGSPGTTFTTQLVAVDDTRGATSAIITSSVVNCNILGGYTGLALKDATWVVVSRNRIQHARGEGLHISTPASSDIGDILIEGNWLHVARTTSPGFAAGTTAALRATSCSGLFVESNKVYCQSSQAFDVNLSESAYEDGGSIMQISHEFIANRFDSGGTTAGSACIKYRFGGAAIAGNTLRDLIVSENRMSNCVNLLDVDAGAEKLEDLVVTDNRGSGGGGLVLAGTVTRRTITDNTFAADGSGFAPSKPIASTQTASEADVVRDNDFDGYADDPDLADTGGGTSTDLTEAQVELTPATGTVTIPVNTGGFTNTYSEIGEAQNITFDVSGADAVVDGARGVHSLHYTGTSGAPTVVAPSGFTVVTAASGATFPTAADDLLVDIHWYIKGTRIRIEKVVSYGTVAGLTTEGGGGGAAIFEDSFDTGTTGTINGRTPDVTAGPNTWVVEGSFSVDTTADYAYSDIPATNNGGVYDTESADGIFTVVVNCPSDVVGAFISVNHDSFTNNWQLWWRVDTGTTTLYKVVGGTFTSVASTTLTWTADTDYEIAITVDGDDITVSRDGVAIGALDWNESSRPLKTNTKVSIMNGSAGIVKFKNAKFEELPA